jgi:hypothetical protein
LHFAGIVNDQPERLLQLPFNLDRAIDGLTKVTLRGGVVGKVTFAVVAVSMAFAAIAWSIHSLWVSAAALGMTFVLAFVMLWRLINFADRNPQAALLEGAEFLVHQQIVHATKTIPVMPVPALEQTQPYPVEGASADPQLAQIPDREEPQSEGGEGKN